MGENGCAGPFFVYKSQGTIVARVMKIKTHARMRAGSCRAGPDVKRLNNLP
jgi:hypothetical protein